MSWLKLAYGTDGLEVYDGPQTEAAPVPGDVPSLIRAAGSGNAAAASQLQSIIQQGDLSACETLGQAAHQFPNSALIKQLLKACSQSQATAPNPSAQQPEMQPPSGSTGASNSSAGLM